MEIDWFTVIAQVINFAILLVILKYTLFDRIVRVMDEREHRIEQRLQDAQKEQQNAQQKADELQRKNDELDEKRDEMIAEIKNDVEQRREKLLGDARDDVDRYKTQWVQAVNRERESFLQKLQHQTGEHLFSLIRSIMRELGDDDAQKKVVDVFMNRLQTIEQEDVDTIVESAGKHPFRIISSFSIPDDMREEIKEIIGSRFQFRKNIKFSVAEDMVYGVELRIDGRKLSWTLEGYLEALKDRLALAFEQLEEPGQAVTTNENSKEQ